MLFNNTKGESVFHRATTKSELFNDVQDIDELVPPPETYYLLDNTGEILFDNTEQPLLVNA